MSHLLTVSRLRGSPAGLMENLFPLLSCCYPLDRDQLLRKRSILPLPRDVSLTDCLLAYSRRWE
jgi:hypothetical protein